MLSLLTGDAVPTLRAAGAEPVDLLPELAAVGPDSRQTQMAVRDMYLLDAQNRRLSNLYGFFRLPAPPDLQPDRQAYSQILPGGASADRVDSGSCALRNTIPKRGLQKAQ